MKFRKLRIAWSVVCGIACVLLICLWVRSCWRFDQIIHRSSATEFVALTTVRGQVAFGGSNDPMLATVFKRDWIHLAFPMKYLSKDTGGPIPVFPVDDPNSAILLWPHFYSPFVMGPPGSTSYELSIPYWLLVVTSAAFAGAPWLRWIIPIFRPYRRVAFSGFCVLASLLLILVWLQSRWWEDIIFYPSLALLLGTLAAVPWIRQLRWQFSLRTLIIVTTLVAVLLGLIVYATRN
jgi:hypothetical protein